MIAVYNRKHSLHSIPHAYHARLPRQRARSVLLAAIVIVLHAGFTPNASGQVIRERVEISPHPTTKTVTTSSSLALLRQDGPVTVINTLPGVRVSVTGTSFQAGGTIPPHASVEIFIWMGGANYTVLTVWADGRGEVFQVKPPVPPRDLLYCGAQVYVTYCLRWRGVFSCTYRYKLASASVSGSTATFTIQDFLSDGWYVNVPFTATVTVGAEPLPGYELAQVIVAPGKTSLRCVDQTTVAMTLKNDLGQNLSICSGAMTTTVSLTGVGPYAFLRRGTQEGQTLSIPMTSATASFEVVVDTARGVIPLGSQQARLRVEVGGVTKDTLMTVSCFYPPPTVRIVRPAHDTTMVLTETHQPVLMLQAIHAPTSGKFEPQISWEPSQTINTAEYFDQIQDSLVITAKVTARNIADMVATDSVRIVLKKNVLDHFVVRVVKDTVAFTESSRIFVQAKDANDQDIELDPGTQLKFSLEGDWAYGTFIKPDGDTLKSTPVQLENIRYDDAKAGKIVFAAVVKNPETSAKPKIVVTLQSDPSKKGEKEIVVVEQTLKIVMSDPREVRPSIPTEDNNAALVQQRRKVFEVVMTRGGKPVGNHPFRLRTDYVRGSGGHDHGNTPTVVRADNHDNYGFFTAGQANTPRRPLDDVTGADGRFDVTYHASIWGDTMKIYLESRNNRLLKDSVKVVERVVELILLPESQNYVKVGGTCNHHGPRTDSEHPNCRTPDNNHSIHPEAADSLARAAEEFLNAPWNTRRERMRINDVSLPYGGLFDINGDWCGPHVSHRNGKDVDIENSRKLQRLREVLEGRRWTYIPEGPNFFPHFRFQ